MLLLARKAEVIHTHKARSLSIADVTLAINGSKPFQEAILRCDQTYLQEIMSLPEPLQLEEVSMALYDNKKYTSYLQKLMAQLQ